MIVIVLRKFTKLMRFFYLLSRIIDRASFTYDADFDLPRVIQAFLDLVSDFAGKAAGGELIDLFRLDDDAHFAARLDRKRFLHAGERVGDIFERLQSFNVEVYRLPPGSRAGG